MLRLDINLVFTVINLLVLYFFMRKFLFGRVNKILEERKALIEKQFADAKTAQDAADGMKTEYEGKLAAAQGEGEEIIARAKAEAKEQSENCWLPPMPSWSRSAAVPKKPWRWSVPTPCGI